MNLLLIIFCVILDVRHIQHIIQFHLTLPTRKGEIAELNMHNIQVITQSWHLQIVITRGDCGPLIFSYALRQWRISSQVHSEIQI